MECVSRGQLAPTALQDLLPSFIQARGAAYTGKLSELSMQFFSGLVQIANTSSQELAELVLPGAVVPEMPPPQFDAAHPATWFQQFAAYASQLSTRATKAYQTYLDRVAAGETMPSQFQHATSSYFERRLPEYLRHAGRLYFDLLNGLNDVRVRYEEEYLKGVLATANRPDQNPSFVLTLSAPLGSTVTAALALANSREERAHIRCTVTEVRRADGVGPAFHPRITITPVEFDLDPGEEASLQLSLQIATADYDLDALYVGAMRVIAQDELHLEVPLHITATPTSADAESARTMAKGLQ